MPPRRSATRRGQGDAWVRRIERWGSLGGDHHPTAAHRKDRWTWWSAAADLEAARRDAAKGENDDGGPVVTTLLPSPALNRRRAMLGIPDRVLHGGDRAGGLPAISASTPGAWLSATVPSRRLPGRMGPHGEPDGAPWDKDDCAAVGLVKSTSSVSEMLEAIHRAVDTIGAYHNDEIDSR